MGRLLDALFPSRQRLRALRALGARFEPNGRDEYHYCEGERRLPIYAERLWGGEHDVEVSLGGVGGWLPPHAAEPISDARRREIFALFLRYLAIFGKRVSVLPEAAPPGGGVGGECDRGA